MNLDQAKDEFERWIVDTWDFKTTKDRHIEGLHKHESVFALNRHAERALISGLHKKTKIPKYQLRELVL